LRRNTRLKPGSVLGVEGERLGEDDEEESEMDEGERQRPVLTGAPRVAIAGQVAKAIRDPRYRTKERASD
jgi:hypothetical protein